MGLRAVTTWRLWHDLHDPAPHELLRWLPRGSQPVRVRGQRWLWVSAGLVALMFIVLVWQSLARSNTLALSGVVLLLTLVALVPLGILLFNGTLLGLFWSVETCASVRRWASPRGWALWQTSPEGAFGVAWQGMIVRLHRDRLMRQSYRIVRHVTVGVMVVILVSTVLFVLSELTTPTSQGLQWVLDTLVSVMSACVVLYADHIQSVTLGCLVGLRQARSTAPVGELMIRAAFEYAIVKSLALLLIALLYAMLQTTSPLIQYLTLPLIVFGVHEGVLTLYSQWVIAAYDVG